MEELIISPKVKLSTFKKFKVSSVPNAAAHFNNVCSLSVIRSILASTMSFTESGTNILLRSTDGDRKHISSHSNGTAPSDALLYSFLL